MAVDEAREYRRTPWDLISEWFLRGLEALSSITIRPLVYFVWITIPYCFWCCTGGFSRHVREEYGCRYGDEDKYWKLRKSGCSNSEILAALYGYEKGHCFAQDTITTCYLNIQTEPQRTDQTTSDYFYELGNEIELFQEKGDRDALQIFFSKVFQVVKPGRIRMGCCRAFSLAKAVYLSGRIGGDPRCGGGIKYPIAPWWQSVVEYRRLFDTLQTKEFKCFVPVHQYRGKELGLCNFIGSDKNGHKGYMDVYFGEEDDIMRYLQPTDTDERVILREVSMSVFDK